MPQWQAQDLGDAMANTLILDVRSPSEYAEGHLDGALNISHLELRHRLDEVAASAGGRPVSVHCASGVRSYLATRVLLSKGFEARNLSGGWLTLKAVHPDI
jgi:rhodanese-related sulfurtransferase